MKKKMPVTEEENTLYAYISGYAVSIEKVKDDLFSEKLLGDGIAIIPSENIITAPCNCKICTVMEASKHAVGCVLENGMEILIHVGIDTVNLNGDGFSLFVKEGESVEKGQKLLSFDKEKIEAYGYDVSCILVVTNSQEYQNIRFYSDVEVQQGQTTVMKF